MVTISNTHANNNSGSGFNILTGKNISLVNFEVNGNEGIGAYLDNSTGTGNILLSATSANYPSRANENESTGIVIRTNGIVSVNRVFVWENDMGGMDVQNHTASLPKAVVISSSTFLENSGAFDGLFVNSKGPITLNAVTAHWNGLNGASLINTYWTLTALPITVTKSSFDNNAGEGLFASATGIITLNSVSASHNLYIGVELMNPTSPVNSPINITGYNNFSHNAGTGVFIYTDGNVSISGVAATFNGTRGIDIFHANVVTLVNSQALNNTNEGVYSYSVGNMTVKNLLVFLNGAGGNNNGMQTNSVYGKIFLYSSSFIGNYGYGFKATVKNKDLDFFMSQVNYMGNLGGMYIVQND